MHGLNTSRVGHVLTAVVVALVFLGVNLATSARSPVVWQDEVMFADPAVNLFLGNGFTTSAWFQDRESVFAGNSPLYSLCLSLWMSVFGFEVVAVRALNYFLILAVTALVLLALGRLGWVRSNLARLSFALLVLCGDGVTYCYRSGRYDCLGMLVVAAIAWVWTLSRGRLRTLSLVALGAAAPWAGLQLLPYMAMIGLVLALIRGRTVLRELGLVAAGCLAGGLLLAGLFWVNGVWGEFTRSVAILAGTRRPLLARLAAALAAPFTEPSSIVLLAALLLLWAGACRQPGRGLRSPAALGVLAGLLVPFLLAVAGKFPRYYCWMAFVPMAACMAAEVQRGRARGLWPALAPLLLLACAAGLPARLAVALGEWGLRDPRPVDRLVAAAVQLGDRVYCEYEAYYPAKKRAAALFLPPYAGLIPEMEGTRAPLSAADRSSINLLILKPATERKTLEYFQGDWRLVAEYSAVREARWFSPLPGLRGARPYELRVYRRQPAAVAAAR